MISSGNLDTILKLQVDANLDDGHGEASLGLDDVFVDDKDVAQGGGNFEHMQLDKVARIAIDLVESTLPKRHLHFLFQLKVVQRVLRRGPERKGIRATVAQGFNCRPFTN
jgi:hypothetical protein